MDPDLQTAATQPGPRLTVAAASMGYGHLRAASSIARRLGVPVTRADLPPLGDDDELRRWRRSRWAYETLSRAAGDPLFGLAARPLLNRLTAIARASSGPDPLRATRPVRALDRAITDGFGRRLAAEMQRLGHGLITTFYAPALAASAHGADPVWCVVTDTDIHRIWVAARPDTCRVVYLAPTQRAADRLRSYGVPLERVEVTGFPLPFDLVGGSDESAARRNQERRLEVLSGRGSRPARLTFAVGGAGAQVSPARTLVRELIPALCERRITITLVAGTHLDLARRFRRTIRHAVASGAPRAPSRSSPNPPSPSTPPPSTAAWPAPTSSGPSPRRCRSSPPWEFPWCSTTPWAITSGPTVTGCWRPAPAWCGDHRSRWTSGCWRRWATAGWRHAPGPVSRPCPGTVWSASWAPLHAILMLLARESYRALRSG
jgi:hypothetical protein